MNTQEKRANAVAQKIEHAQHLVNRLNKEGQNWFPLIEFIADGSTPNERAKDLTEIYFSLAEYAVSDEEYGCRPELRQPLYVLRSIIEALNEMSNYDERLISFKARDPQGWAE